MIPEIVITDNEDNFSCPAEASKVYQENKTYHQVMTVNGKTYVEDVTGLVKHFADQ